MNARRLLDFLKKPEGRFFIAVCLILFLLAFVWLFYGSKASQAKADSISDSFHKGKEGIEDLASDVPRFKPAPVKPPLQTPQPGTNEPKPPPPIPIGIGKTVVPSVSLSSESAPYGRLIKCKLVITVDSSSVDTPIIGLVTEDVYNSYGDLIIPAGSEVHGTAQTDRVRERIGSNNAVLQGMTFSGHFPCSLCKAIASRKSSDQQKALALEKYDKKFVLPGETSAYASPSLEVIYSSPAVVLRDRNIVPWLPPPRPA
jgi:hypothetical protein